MSNEVSNHWDRLVDQIIGKYDDEVTIADLGSGRGEVGELLHEAGYWKVDAYDINITKLEKRKPLYRNTYWHNLAKKQLFGQYDILTAAGFLTGHSTLQVEVGQLTFKMLILNAIQMIGINS